MRQASLRATAVMAFGVPRRARRRRKKAPRADWLWERLRTARRSAVAARLEVFLVAVLRTLPPEILLPGDKPIQEVKCFSVFHGVMSGPVSEITLRAV